MGWKPITLVVGSAAVVGLILAVGARRSAHGAPEPVKCKPNYAYAGVEDASRRYGIRAYLTAVHDPVVEAGHVAAWLGVGGAGLGPHGSDEWLQTGYMAFFAGPRQIYYEVVLPGQTPVYQVVRPRIRKGQKHLLAVLEMPRKPGRWRVWLDGRPVSPAIA